MAKVNSTLEIMLSVELREALDEANSTLKESLALQKKMDRMMVVHEMRMTDIESRQEVLTTRASSLSAKLKLAVAALMCIGGPVDLTHQQPVDVLLKRIDIANEMLDQIGYTYGQE